MDPRITWIVAYVRDHVAEPLTVAGLAARVNLSPSRFSHLFRVDVGVSPVQFIRAVRMARARLLLERTFLTVKEVMTLVGCSDPSHFSRDYRHAHGMAPRQWRNAYGERRPGYDAPAAPDPSAAAGDTTDSAHVRQKSLKGRKRAREPGTLSYRQTPAS
jgi:AraC family transcriptional regulator of arabinose operon